MKKYFFLALVCLTTLGMAAQNRPSQTPPPGNNQPGQYDNHHGNGGRDQHHNDAYNEGYRAGYQDGLRDQQHNGHHGNQPGNHHGNQPGPGQHQPTPAPAPVKASAEQLQWALQMIEKQSYDDKRMEVAKLCVVLCPFTTRDLGKMVDLFTMEDRKVDFLIFAHQYCPDKENYYYLRDKLRYRSDQDKLMERVQPGYYRR